MCCAIWYHLYNLLKLTLLRGCFSRFLNCANDTKSRNAPHIWVFKKVFKNGPSKICGRQPLKNMKWCGLPKQTISLEIFWRLSFTNFTWFILKYLDPNYIWRESTLWWRTLFRYILTNQKIFTCERKIEMIKDLIMVSE